ncbi:hypothetical protein LGQ02_08770 [Bacillus shivajii]|uniref:YpoC family protein n=1 Tax=Bacillus shivajii TaxID=1983719 RepID=UPI001CF9FC11|nr:hypothetical protein [Bacillus shivajii]UCZ54819.1 hypothetical protein LGQ02_08770 [Bacillus shivajii]
MTDKLLVPNQFQYSPFYKEGDEIEKNSIDQEIIRDNSYFAYDICACLKVSLPYEPWQSPQCSIKRISAAWKEEGQELLKECFQNRDRKTARPIMLQYTSLYIQAMFWANSHAVETLENIPSQLNEFSYSPMNIQERISFVLDSPDHYHAFTTLDQLYQESMKKWAVYFTKKH